MNIAAAARTLDALRADGALVLPLPADIAPRTDAEGAALQAERARRADAYPPAGFKIGATGARMQAYLGLPGPAAGFVARIKDSGFATASSALRRPGVECEIAVRLRADLAPGPCDPGRAAEAVGAVAAAIELVENRYDDIHALGTPTLIADQVYHRAAVVGTPVEDWRGLDLAALEGRLRVDGTERDRGLGAELLGDPLACLAWLAGSDVATAFGGLRAGQWVLLGSVVPVLWVDGPCAVTVSFTHLGSVSLSLA